MVGEVRVGIRGSEWVPPVMGKREAYARIGVSVSSPQASSAERANEKKKKYKSMIYVLVR